MPTLLKEKPVYETVYPSRHAKYERRETRVSEFMRLYSTGKIEQIPENKIPLVPDDNRSQDQMLNDTFCPSMATEPVEVMQYIEEHAKEYQDAVNELKKGAANKRKYKQALKVFQDPNSTDIQRFEAEQTLKELKRK